MMANNSTVVVPTNAPDLCFVSFIEFDPKDINRPDSFNPTMNSVIAVNGLAAPPTIVINALVIWAVVGDENIRSSAFNILLASLAVTDLLVGLLVEPFHCALHACLLNYCPTLDCSFTAYVLSTLVCSSITMVSFTMASIERYLAIEHPNFYLNNVTIKRVIITTITAWIIILGYSLITTALLNRHRPDLYKIPWALALSILGLTILYCSSKVQLTAYRQKRIIALQEESVQQPSELQQQERRLQEYKRVSMMTMLVVFSVLFYTPFIIGTAIEFVNGKEVTSDFKYIAWPICSTFVNIQSLINPIIMSLRLSYIRQGIKNKLISLVQAWN